MAEKFSSSDPRREEDKILGSLWEELTQSESEAVAWFYEIQDLLAAQGISLEKSSKILEVGTGAGMLMHLLNRRGYDVVGVDARPRHEGALPIAVARVESLPFGDKTFDFVLSRGVFSNLYEQDQVKMLQEVERVLKDGGIFYGVPKPRIADEDSIAPVRKVPTLQKMRRSTEKYDVFRKSPGN